MLSYTERLPIDGVRRHLMPVSLAHAVTRVGSTNLPLQLLIGGVGRGRQDVLLREDTLDDAGRALDGLKEARRDGDDVEVDTATRNLLGELVAHREVDLKGEVADQTRCLTRLEGEVPTRTENQRTADGGDEDVGVREGIRNRGRSRLAGLATPSRIVHLQTVLHGHLVELVLGVVGEQTREEFFESAALHLENLARLMREAAKDPALRVYYHDAGMSKSA